MLIYYQEGLKRWPFKIGSWPQAGTAVVECVVLVVACLITYWLVTSLLPKTATHWGPLNGHHNSWPPSWFVTVTVLAAWSCAELVVGPAEGWLLPPPLQAVSSSAAASPATAGSAVA